MRLATLILVTASLASGLVLPCAHMRHLRQPQLAMLADAPASKQASSPSAGQSEANSDNVQVFKTDKPSEDPTVTCWLDTDAATVKEAWLCTDELMDAEHSFKDGKKHGDDSY